jgi:hypothetical protein
VRRDVHRSPKRRELLLLLRFRQDHELFELIENNEQSNRSKLWRCPPPSRADFGFRRCGVAGPATSARRRSARRRAGRVPGLDKARIEKEAEPFGKNLRFRGFDGNNETEYLGVSRFLIEHLDRFTHFKGRDLNSHMPSIEAYRRMYEVFKPMRNSLGRGELNASQIIEILKAELHPSMRAAHP